MTSRSEPNPLAARDLADFGFARVRDLAFDAVQRLWRRRQAEGMSQKHVADVLQRDPAWVSRRLRAPGNWTLRTFGEFVQALDGEAEITVYALEDPPADPQNFDAYEGYITPNKYSLTYGTAASAITSLKADTQAQFSAHDLLVAGHLSGWKTIAK